jgi:hypothetical protein
MLSAGSFCRSVIRRSMLFFSSAESLPCSDWVASTRCMPSDRPLAATLTSSRRKFGDVSRTRANSSKIITTRGRAGSGVVMPRLAFQYSSISPP